MNSCELATYVTATACFIFDSFDDDEILVICTMITQLNDTLKTMAAQRIFCKKQEEKLKNNQTEDISNINTCPCSNVNENSSENVSNNAADNKQNTSKINTNL